VDRTKNNIALVQMLLNHLKEKEKELKRLRRVENSNSDFQLVFESLRTMASCSGLLKHFSDSEDILKLSEDIVHSLLFSLQANIVARSQ
jgi:hypothetical protein